MIEQLAAIEHERWAHWQRYMHSKGHRQSDGSLLIPAELVSQWQGQIERPYAELNEDEKASDREQVEKYLPTIIKALERTDSRQ
ncbi:MULTISPECIES: hypothetical protein [Methylorubrum]|uniref:hypothetical protein n=1 Tax=Methylorubrum TaxID=2282523 RepID=UPI0020A04B1D|nr:MULTISPECIES: hypothetical protein [Methylorubrum]MCP1581737.1 hypothetical protein [Methylorubrum extorquens]